MNKCFVNGCRNNPVSVVSVAIPFGFNSEIDACEQHLQIYLDINRKRNTEAAAAVPSKRRKAE